MFPNGLIMQWGKVKDVPGHEEWRQLFFPIAFPHKALSINLTYSLTENVRETGFTAGLCSPTLKFDSLTKIGAIIGLDGTGSISTASRGVVYWFAIGY